MRSFKTHIVKAIPEYFDSMKRGVKTFDIRENMDFQVGDTIIYEEYDSLFDCGKPTGRTLIRTIVYVLGDDSGHIMEGDVALSIR